MNQASLVVSRNNCQASSLFPHVNCRTISAKAFDGRYLPDSLSKIPISFQKPRVPLTTVGSRWASGAISLYDAGLPFRSENTTIDFKISICLSMPHLGVGMVLASGIDVWVRVLKPSLVLSSRLVLTE